MPSRFPSSNQKIDFQNRFKVISPARINVRSVGGHSGGHSGGYSRGDPSFYIKSDF
jgi:hypothetical protein